MCWLFPGSNLVKSLAARFPEQGPFICLTEFGLWWGASSWHIIPGSPLAPQLEHLLRASKPREMSSDSDCMRITKKRIGTVLRERVRRKPRGERWPQPFLQPLGAGQRATKSDGVRVRGIGSRERRKRTRSDFPSKLFKLRESVTCGWDASNRRFMRYYGSFWRTLEGCEGFGRVSRGAALQGQAAFIRLGKTCCERPPSPTPFLSP